MAIVYKTLGSESLDHFYSGIPSPLNQALQHGLNLMNASPTNLAGAAQPLENSGDLPANTASELDQYWVSPPGGADVERVMRHGYEEAIALASTHEPDPMPIETFLVTGAGEDFEIHICEGKHAVTVFMFVPDGRSYGSKRSSSKSWVVRVGGRRERAKKEQLDDADEPVVKTQVSGVKD